MYDGSAVDRGADISTGPDAEAISVNPCAICLAFSPAFCVAPTGTSPDDALVGLTLKADENPS